MYRAVNGGCVGPNVGSSFCVVYFRRVYSDVSTDILHQQINNHIFSSAILNRDFKICLALICFE